MQIYLVRIRERSNGSLTIEYKPQVTTDDDYVAISHVWGHPDVVQKTDVDGVRWKVALSPGKKDILSVLRRDDICGEGWFWMDLFCIDQTESASISIADQLSAIPSIYKSSRCVKVLIESPICQVWQDSVVETLQKGSLDEEGFKVQELDHAKSCTNFFFKDPWFERLWTRQEGLYAQLLDFIILRPVRCEDDRQKDKTEDWIDHGKMLSHRFRSETFVLDKLAYHGIALPDAANSLFEIYLDVVYRHRLNITLVHNCLARPASKFNPIKQAWQSNRTTAKKRDYVLAVFPDIEGYKVPPNARKLSFPELFLDAINQPAVFKRLKFLPKIPRGMSDSKGKAVDSMLPWLNPEPSNIGEAYDTFAAETLDGGDTDQDRLKARKIAIPGSISLQDIKASKSTLIELVNSDWGLFTAINNHIALLSPAGPCTGLDRTGLEIGTASSDSHAIIGGGRLHHHLAQEFMHVATSQWLPEQQMNKLESRTKNVLPSTEMANIEENIFTQELKRFIVCLVCGTSLPTADAVLESADVVRVMTPHGNLLGLIHKLTKKDAEAEKLVLICDSDWHIQGFLIGLRIPGGITIRGRTVIPSKAVWDSIEGMLTKK